jgi:hypothetical protein
MSDGSGEKPSADEVERKLRELTDEISGAARIREPSAAEREKAGRERSQDRSRARSPKPGKRRGGAWLVGWSVAVLVLAGGGYFGWHQESKSSAGGPDDTRVVTNGAVPKTSPPASSASVTPLAGPPADPFADSPADNWADGAAGLAAPAAAPHGAFTASQVTAAYATTRTLLTAQDLDHTTLLGGAPTAFANVLTSQQRAQFTAGLDKIGLNKKGYELSTRSWVASFAPATTALIGTVIKVHGTMSARSGLDDGHPVLDVDVNYRFVYPVEPPRAHQDWMRVVGQVTGYIEFENVQDPGGPLQPWVVSAFPAEAGTRCGVTDGYIHPYYPGGPAATAKPTGATVNPYAMNNPPLTGSCQPTTGT